jgi:hypothetical protein
MRHHDRLGDDDVRNQSIELIVVPHCKFDNSGVDSSFFICDGKYFFSFFSPPCGVMKALIDLEHGVERSRMRILGLTIPSSIPEEFDNLAYEVI